MSREPTGPIGPPQENLSPAGKDLGFLPRTFPAVPALEFTSNGGGWPPEPRGQTQVRELEAEQIPGALTDAFAEEIRKYAIYDTRVAALLGDRFVHLTTDMRRWGKGRRPDPSVPLETRIIFYSESNNLAVEVWMKGLSVQGAVGRQGVQPPEVPEEIEEAVALARRHPAIRDLVHGLAAGGLLLPRQDGDPGPGQRIIWVTFFEAAEIEGEKPALFSAAVDLIEQKVLVARAEPPISGYRSGSSETTDA